MKTQPHYSRKAFLHIAWGEPSHPPLFTVFLTPTSQGYENPIVFGVCLPPPPPSGPLLWCVPEVSSPVAFPLPTAATAASRTHVRDLPPVPQFWFPHVCEQVGGVARGALAAAGHLTHNCWDKKEGPFGDCLEGTVGIFLSPGLSSLFPGLTLDSVPEETGLG